jgi:hypothetical protein
VNDTALPVGDTSVPRTESPPRKWTLRTIWFLAVVLLAAILLFPIRFDSLRMVEVGTLCLLWAGALYLWWNRRAVRYALVGSVAVGGLLLLAPGRADDPAAFRSDYVAALRRYEGVTYVWGGETRLGVDCSGLTRAAFVDTCYQRGLATLNPALLREGLSMWWHDRSARAIGEGYRGESSALFESGSINALDHSRLLPGDLAVTGGGVHIMAYIGGSEWIEADPKEMRVIRVRAPSDKVSWLDMPVTLVRWSRLAQQAAGMLEWRRASDLRRGVAIRPWG